MKLRYSFCVSLLVCLLASQWVAADDITRRATRLEPLELNAADGFSIKRYELEAGVYYRWRIQSDGLEEYKLLAPDFFRESWIDQVVVEGLEVKPMGLHAVEFDRSGQMDVWFVTIRPGTYPFYIEGLERQGFSGEFVVK
ncbi:hypothetical protein BKP64_09325 [Marinobacter salinus]|uniref:Copper-binding protein n=1 Tax=Marinobacter salinus TaxID=1874317 RepID=A0A1D9GL30_9GAMM|nr:hypothetical protein [Marinobacter salinus]AOY88348.1 hypothetical protein BKP64_09325 [Marinobacter salinus]